MARKSGEQAREFRDALDGVGKRGSANFRRRQGEQSGGVRDRNDQTRKKDDELFDGGPGSGSGSRPDGSRPDGGQGRGGDCPDGWDRRADADEIADQIANGHAYDKHVLDGREFPDIKGKPAFAARIAETIRDGRMFQLLRGRTAFWNNGTTVIHDPWSVDGGTAFWDPDMRTILKELDI